MPTKKPTMGESLGSLVASLVDTTLSCCEAYKGSAGTGTGTGTEVSWTIGVRLGCSPGQTGVPGQTEVNLTVPANYPGGVPLGPPKMQAVPPGLPVPPSSYTATAPPQAPMGTTAIRVSISPTLPRGLYLGELRAMLTSGAVGPHCPVVIYLDGLT